MEEQKNNITKANRDETLRKTIFAMFNVCLGMWLVLIAYGIFVNNNKINPIPCGIIVLIAAIEFIFQSFKTIFKK